MERIWWPSSEAGSSTEPDQEVARDRYEDGLRRVMTRAQHVEAPASRSPSGRMRLPRRVFTARDVGASWIDSQKPYRHGARMKTRPTGSPVVRVPRRGAGKRPRDIHRAAA